jgi:hypothetical protein
MAALCRCQIFFNVVMALHTEHGLRLYEHARIRAAVGVVAGQTLAIFKRAMNAGAFAPLHELLVTAYAELRVYGLQETLLIGAVAAMTADTVPSRHGCVGAGLSKLVFELHVTGVTHHV